MAEPVAGSMARIAALAGAPAVRAAAGLCAGMRLPPRSRAGAFHDRRMAAAARRQGRTPGGAEGRSLLPHEFSRRFQAASGAFDFDMPMARRPDIRRAARSACAARFARGLDR